MHQPCPNTWKKCHPHQCSYTPKGPPTNVPKPNVTPLPHNVLLLVDEHEITGNDPNKPVQRNDLTTLRRRYVWYHDCVNLDTMNVPDIPIVINLDDQLGDPTKNKAFRWEGFMFDIPAGPIAVRVAIVAGADNINDNALTGNGGQSGASVDRPIGFAATYADPKVPIGPVVQVRRDDQYRLLGASMNFPKKVVWRCAYYITKETPKTVSGIRPLSMATDDAPHVQRDPQSTLYDELMDKNVDESLAISDDAEPWGGMVFNNMDFDSVPEAVPDDSELGAADSSQ